MPPLNKKKFLSFLLFSNLIVLFIFELLAYSSLRIFYTPNILAGEQGEYDLQLAVNPFLEFDKKMGTASDANPLQKKPKCIQLISPWFLESASLPGWAKPVANRLLTDVGS